MRLEIQRNGTANRALQAIYDKNALPITYLNGKHIKFMQTADTDTGYVKYCPEDGKGQPTFDLTKDDYVFKEEYGVVTISLSYQLNPS